MSIFEAIKKLREKLTGQPGKGASIVDAINDLTEGLTGEPGKGASIADAISNLAEHSDDISINGGGDKPATITTLFDGTLTTTDEGYGAYGQASFEVMIPYDQSDEKYGYPDYISVLYDGVEYADIPYDSNNYGYGASWKDNGYDFSVYPFLILPSQYSGYITDYFSAYTETEGDHSVCILANIGEHKETTVYNSEFTSTEQSGQYVASPVYMDISLNAYPSSMNVVFEGTEYNDLSLDGFAYYGAPYDGEAFDFTDIPFSISLYDSGGGHLDAMCIYTSEAGTFSMTANALTYVKGNTDISLVSLSVSQNGTYQPGVGTAYNYVDVSVPTLPEKRTINFVNGTSDMHFTVVGLDEGLTLKTYDNVLPNNQKTFYYPLFYGETVVVKMDTNSVSATFPDGMIATVSGSDSGVAHMYYSSDKRQIFISLSSVESSCTITVTTG